MSSSTVQPPSRSKAFQQAASLNNQGITALRNGDFDYASTVLFPQAIGILKSELTCLGQADTYQLDYDVADIQLLQRNTPTVGIDMITSLREETDDDDDDDDSYLFHRAISIPTDIDIENDIHVNEFCLHMYTTVVIYNMTLSHHLMLLATTAENHGYESEKENSGTTLATKVEQLYVILLKLFRDGSALLNMRTGLLIKLACINNLSHVRNHNYSSCSTDDLDLSQRHQQEVLEHVAYFMQQSSRSNQALFQELMEEQAQETMTDEDENGLQVLLHNAVLLLHADSPVSSRRNMAAAA